MKKLNYYQVHKNKKPKVKYEKRIIISAKYFVKMAKNSIRMRDALISFQDSMDEFVERINTPSYSKKEEMRGIYLLETLQKEGKIIISIDSGRGTI